MPPETKTFNENEIVPELKKFEGISKSKPSSYKAMKFYDEMDAPKMVRLVMRYSGGIIKEQKQAEYVLFGFVILVIITSLFLFFGGIGGNGAKPPTNNQIEQIIKNQQGVRTP